MHFCLDYRIQQQGGKTFFRNQLNNDRDDFLFHYYIPIMIVQILHEDHIGSPIQVLFVVKKNDRSCNSRVKNDDDKQTSWIT